LPASTIPQFVHKSTDFAENLFLIERISIEHLADEGLLKQKEANHFIELTGHALSGLKYCSKKQHPGELTRRGEMEMMALPSFCKHSRNLHYKPSSVVSAASQDHGDNF